MIANTPKPPYYAVIFTSVLNSDDDGYSDMGEQMERMVSSQPGFLGFESARSEIGITVSYWESIAAIKEWKYNSEHSIAREKGKNLWYKSFKVRVAKIERDYEM